MTNSEVVSRAVLADFLREIDTSFPVSLSAKVNIDDYAEKLLNRAELVVHVEGGYLAGLVAGYTENLPSHGLAYISLVGVRKRYRQRGIARKLIEEFLGRCERKGLRGVHLYADPSNIAAVSLYEDKGFTRERFAAESRLNDIHYLKLLNRTALVTAVGSFSAARVISDLQSMDFRVVGCDIYPEVQVANSQVVDAFYKVPLASDEEAYVGEIKRIAELEGAAYVIPLTDVEVDVLGGLDEVGDVVCLSSVEALAVCRDKVESYRRLNRSLPGCVIPTYLLEDERISHIEYPVACKPRDGRSSEGLFFANSFEELSSRSSVLDRARYCVQPRVEGSVVTVDVVRNEISGKMVAVPRLELLRTPNGAGTSVRVFRDGRISDLAKGIAAEFGVHGCVNIEFIVDANGRPHFLECNPRFSGGVEFTCMSGYECVRNHIRCFLGLEIEDEGELIEQYIARVYTARVTGAAS